MKKVLRRLFRPLFDKLEQGSDDYRYSRTHRTVLATMGIMFTLLAIAAGAAGLVLAQPGALIPAAVFGGVGLVALVVAIAGEDRAVSKIWGNK